MDPNAVPVSPDGNTVNLENEMLQLNQNSLANTVETQVMSNNFYRLRMAITGSVSLTLMIDILSGIQSTAAALDAERTRLDVISENIANANTTHGPDGKPYQRQIVMFETALQQAMSGGQITPTLQRRRHRQGLPPV